MTTTDRDAWKQLSTNLALTLTRMPADGFLILGAAGNRFIRFRMMPRWLWCEITHNDQLADDQFRMTAESETILTEQGWYLPPESVSDNWFKHVNWPSRYHEYQVVADECTTAIHEFLHVDSPTELTVKSWVAHSSKTFNTELLGLTIASTT